MNAIELKNVNFSYDGKTRILENVNIALNYGEVNLVSGHSGEGKSTLLYIISGIIPNITDGNLSGEVLINGEEANALARSAAKSASFCKMPTNRLFRKRLRTKSLSVARIWRFPRRKSANRSTQSAAL